MRTCSALLLALATAACGGTTPGQTPTSAPASAPTAAPETPTTPPAPQATDESELPLAVRKLLEPRMGRHGKDFAALHEALEAKNYAAVERAARAIADESTIARPLPGDDESLNARIPERFFALQSALRARAEELAEAARGGSPERVRQSYEALGATCASCHETWFPLEDG